jgi:hypothetical protein
LGTPGELELLRVAGGGSAVSSVEVGRTADNLYLKEQFDEAILTWRAAQQARVAGDVEAAITWSAKRPSSVAAKRHRAPHNAWNVWRWNEVPQSRRDDHGAWNAAQAVRENNLTRAAALLDNI